MARLQVAEARLGAVWMVARVRPLVTALLPASVTRSRESELGPQQLRVSDRVRHGLVDT